HIIASVPNSPDSTPPADVNSSPILQGQSAAIQQLQEGMQSVSSAIQGIEDRQESARESDQQWRQQMHAEVEQLKSSVDNLASNDDSEWKDSVQSQVASLRDSIESLAETTAENIASLAAKTEAGFASQKTQEDALQRQQDIEQQFQHLRSAVETASLPQAASSTEDTFGTQETVAYESVSDHLAQEDAVAASDAIDTHPFADVSPSPVPAEEASPSPTPAAEASPSPTPAAEASPSPTPVDEVAASLTQLDELAPSLTSVDEVAAAPSPFESTPEASDSFADLSPGEEEPNAQRDSSDAFEDPLPAGGPATVHDFSPGSLTVGREELESELTATASPETENPFSEFAQPSENDSIDTFEDAPQQLADESFDSEQNLPATFDQQSAALFAEPESDTTTSELPYGVADNEEPSTGLDSTTSDFETFEETASSFESSDQTPLSNEVDLPSVGGNLAPGSLLEQLEQEERNREAAASQTDETPSAEQQSNAELESSEPVQDVAAVASDTQAGPDEGASDLPSWWTESVNGGDSVQLNEGQALGLSSDAVDAAEPSSSPETNETNEFSFGGESLSSDSSASAPELDAEQHASVDNDLAPAQSADGPELPQPGSLAALLAAHETDQVAEPELEGTASEQNEFHGLALDEASQETPTAPTEADVASLPTDVSVETNSPDAEIAQDLPAQLDLPADNDLSAVGTDSNTDATPTDESVPQEEAEQFFGLGAETPTPPEEAAAPKLTLAELEQAERENDATASLSSPNLESSAPSYADDDEEDGSVEDYMKKLLARMRGVPEDEVEVPGTDEDSNTPPTPAPIAQQPVAPEAAPSADPASILDSASQPTAANVPAEEEKMSFESFTPRVSAPERTQSLAAMRELANSSARTAIHRSTRKRHVSGLALKASISIIGLIVGLVLLTINGLTMNIGLVATVAAFLVAGIWGYDAITTLKPLMQAGLVLKPNPNNENKNAAQPPAEE
ncbi:MAG: hypothetical protein AAGG44_03205, partial [Planctomycetota bacterium]